MIEHPDIRRKLGEAGRERVEERFSLESNVKKTEELYFRILKYNGAF